MDIQDLSLMLSFVGDVDETATFGVTTLAIVDPEDFMHRSQKILESSVSFLSAHRTVACLEQAMENADFRNSRTQEDSNFC